MARNRVIVPEDAVPPGQKFGITTYNNGTETVAASENVIVAADGTPITGDATNGLDVDVTRLPAITGSVSVSNFPSSQAVTGTFFQATQPVSLASLPTLPAGTNNIGDVDVLTMPSITGTVAVSNSFALDATVGTTNTEIGATNETAPATDTASSGLNGRLQRIAQRLTTFMAQLPTTLGQKTKANSLAVTLASDQDALPASQSGTWTVQPGNTANTTAWKVDGSAVTQPVSGTFWQATQPVSLSSLPASTNTLEIVGDAASGAAKSGNPVQVGGVFNTTQPTVTNGQVVEAQSTARGAQIVSTGVDTFNVTVNAALPAGSNAIGKLAANSGVIIGDVNDIPPTLTKGTQGSTGFSVQNLTDAGRTYLGFTAQNVTAGTSGTEVMASFSQNKGGTVTTSVTSYTVTNGKRLRLVCLQIAITAQAATVTRLLANIRSNSAGATTTGSNLVAGYDIGGPAVSGQTAYETIPLGEAFEFVGDGTLTIGVSFVPTWTTTAAKVSVTLHGYEY